MALILGLSTRLVEADHFTRAGRFHQEQSMTFLWHALPGKVLGLIGMGAIGQQIAKRPRAFEMDVVYTKTTRLGRWRGGRPRRALGRRQGRDPPHGGLRA